MSLDNLKIGDIVILGKCESKILGINSNFVWRRYINDSYIYSDSVEGMKTAGWKIKETENYNCGSAFKYCISCSNYDCKGNNKNYIEPLKNQTRMCLQKDGHIFKEIMNLENKINEIIEFINKRELK